MDVREQMLRSQAIQRLAAELNSTRQLAQDSIRASRGEYSGLRDKMGNIIYTLDEVTGQPHHNPDALPTPYIPNPATAIEGIESLAVTYNGTFDDGNWDTTIASVRVHVLDDPDDPVSDLTTVAHFFNHDGGTIAIRVEAGVDKYVLLQTINIAGVRGTLSEPSGPWVALEAADAELLNELNTVTLPALQADLLAAQGDITTLETVTIPALNTILTANSAAITTLNTVTIPAINATLTTLDADITSLGGDLTILNADLATAQGDINTLNTVTIPDLNSDLAAEAVSRAAADSTLTTNLATAQGQINTLNSTTIPALSASLTTAQGQINTLNSTTIPGINAALATEVTNRTNADTTLTTNLSTAQGQINTLNSTTIPGINTALATEVTNRTAADATLTTNLSTAQGQINTLNSTTIPGINAALATEVTNRTNADTTLTTNLTTAQGQINILNSTTIPGLNATLVTANANIATLQGKFPVQAVDVGFTTGGGNKVVNSRADNGTTTWISFSGTLAAVATHGHSGANSFEVTATAAGGATYLYREWNSTSPSLKIIAGNKYVLSAWVTTSINTTPALHTREYNGSTINSTTNIIGTALIANTPKRIVLPFTALVGSISTGIGIYFVAANIGDKMWVTDIQLEEGDLATAYAPKPDEILPDTIDAPMLQAGSVITAKMTANSIDGNRVTANTLDATKIIADSITATQIAASAITASELAANSVIAAKILAGEIATSHMTANTINGDRVTANTLNASKIVAGSVTTTQMTANTIDGSVITANTLNASKIVAGSIASDRMTANTITGDRIQANTLDAAKIVAGSVTTDRMTANTIDGDRISANTLNAAKIIAGSIASDRMTANTITGDRIQANTLDAAKIVAGSVTSDRMTANTITGDRIQAGTLDAAKITAGSVTSDRMTANTITGDRIQANTLDAAKIVAGSITTDRMTANSINGDRISANTLNANKIIANTITATQIAAGAITTDKLTVASFGDNLILNGNFRDIDSATGDPTFWAMNGTGTMGYITSGVDTYLQVITVAGSGTGAYQGIYEASRLTANPGDVFYAEVGAGSAGGGHGWWMELYCYDRANTYLGSATDAGVKTTSNDAAVLQVRQGSVLTACPAGTTYARAALYMVGGAGAVNYSFSNYTLAKVNIGARIADGAITTPKMTANTIDGDRITANTLNAAKIIAGTIATDRMTANSINGDRVTANTLDAAKIVADSITATQIQASAITASELAANAVTAAKILAGEIATSHMTSNTINGDRITANTLNATKIVAGSVSTTEMTANSINGDRIAANTIAATKIVANSITASQIAAGTITANEIAAGTITTTQLNAAAINGMTITGAVFQTSSSGQRFVIDGPGDIINFYSGASGESPGHIDPILIAGVPSLDIRPGTNGVYTEQARLTLSSGGSLASSAILAGGTISLSSGNTISITAGAGGISNLNLNAATTATSGVLTRTGDPYYFASQTTATALTGATNLNFPEVEDTHNAAASGVFTVPAGKGGLYFITAQIKQSTAVLFGILIRKNGANIMLSPAGPATAFTGALVSGHTRLVAGDVITWQVNTGVTTQSDGAGVHNNFIQIRRVA